MGDNRIFILNNRLGIEEDSIIAPSSNEMFQISNNLDVQIKKAIEEI